MTMQPPPSHPQRTISTKEIQQALSVLTAINRLTLKAFSTKDRKAFIFLMLNDTIQVVRYDRAVLINLEGVPPKLMGVSGQTTITASTDLAKKWRAFVEQIKDPQTPQILTEESFKEKKELWRSYSEAAPQPNVLWYPIKAHGKTRMGLWLERWNGTTWNPEEIEILGFLIQAYGIAWERFVPYYAFHRLRNRLLSGLGILTLFLLFLIHIPLRIVAPCEVVPKDPNLVTAPLEDIVEMVKVKPGELVKKGDILFEYDKRVALQTLRVAENQVQVAKQDLTRAKTLAFKDERSLAEVAVLDAKLKKEEANLQLAKYRASQLIVRAPVEGIVMLEDPDEWRGKPVKVGEKVLIISDPTLTKVRLWIPENDHIVLDLDDPIDVFLNVTPTITRKAKLNFISNASTVTEHNLISFMAEADWIKPQEDVRVGLKGSSILYGERVTLFYWIIRKPWATFRTYVGF